MTETVHLRGEGGVVWPFDLPLPEAIQSRWDNGQLLQVNEDGSAWSDVDEMLKPLTPKEALQRDAAALGLDTAGTIVDLTARIDAHVVELLKQATELGIDAENLSAVDLASAIEAKLAE